MIKKQKIVVKILKNLSENVDFLQDRPKDFGICPAPGILQEPRWPRASKNLCTLLQICQLLQSHHFGKCSHVIFEHRWLCHLILIHSTFFPTKSGWEIPLCTPEWRPWQKRCHSSFKLNVVKGKLVATITLICP